MILHIRLYASQSGRETAKVEGSWIIIDIDLYIIVSISHTIHVWYIYLHLLDFHG